MLLLQALVPCVYIYKYIHRFIEINPKEKKCSEFYVMNIRVCSPDIGAFVEFLSTEGKHINQ